MLDTGQFYGTSTDSLSIYTTGLYNGQVFRCIATLDDCEDTSGVSVLYVKYNAGVADLNKNPLFTVSPNPTQGTIYIKTSAQFIGTRFFVRSSLGVVVLSGKITSLETLVDLRNLAEGVYFISLGGYENSIVRVLKE